MKEYTITEDIKTLCFKATSFPMGVMDSFKTMHNTIPDAYGRVNYGISQGNAQGGINYMAAVPQKEDNEAQRYNCDTFTIKAGKYISKELKDIKGNETQFATAFQELLKHPDVDPNGYCLEIYGDDNTATCLVKLKDE